jgi:rhodanese-related sulfurtransferase
MRFNKGTPMVYQISPEDLKSRLDKDESVILVDVRQPWEHETARIDNSLLIPLGELQTRTQEVSQDEGLVVVYCHHGVRSLSGAAILEAAGFKQVASLAGGTDRWSLLIDASLPRY